MRFIKTAATMYINKWRTVIDNGTMEDAIKMGLLGILLLVGAIYDALHAF